MSMLQYCVPKPCIAYTEGASGECRFLGQCRKPGSAEYAGTVSMCTANSVRISDSRHVSCRSPETPGFAGSSVLQVPCGGTAAARTCFKQQARQAAGRHGARVASGGRQAVGDGGGVVSPEAAHIPPRQRCHLYMGVGPSLNYGH